MLTHYKKQTKLVQFLIITLISHNNFNSCFFLVIAYLFREQVFSALSVFEDIVNFNFDYDLESKIYSSALDLIKLMTKYYSQDKLMSDYNSIFFEILMQIDSNLEDYSESSECEKLIQFFDDVNIS